MSLRQAHLLDPQVTFSAWILGSVLPAARTTCQFGKALTIHSRGTLLCPIIEQASRGRPLNSGVSPKIMSHSVSTQEAWTYHVATGFPVARAKEILGSMEPLLRER